MATPDPRAPVGPIVEPPPVLQLTFCTTANMGDHGAEVRIALEHIPGESLDDTMARAAQCARPYGGVPYNTDTLEVRVVTYPPKPLPNPWGSSESPF